MRRGSRDADAPEPRLNIVYVGASQHDGVEDPLVDFAAQQHARIWAFDADRDSLQGVHAAFPRAELVSDDFVGDGRPVQFNTMRQSGQSSRFSPGPPAMGIFSNFSENLESVGCSYRESRRLDDLDLPRPVDLIKIDVQGGQNDVFTGATEVLRHCQVIEVECEFVEQYAKAPLFHQTAGQLSQLGFQFHKFAGYGSRTIRGVCVEADEFAPGSQWLWAECLFVKNFGSWSELSDRQLAGMTVILLDYLDSIDIAALAASLLCRRSGRDAESLWERVAARAHQMGIDVDRGQLDDAVSLLVGAS